MHKKEIIIHYNTSSDLFKNNRITDFKTILPYQNYIQSYSNICVKNVLCEFTRDNVLNQSKPVLLKTEYSNVLDFFKYDSITGSSKKNLYNSLLGKYYARYDSIGNTKSTYLLLKKQQYEKHNSML